MRMRAKNVCEGRKSVITIHLLLALSFLVFQACQSKKIEHRVEKIVDATAIDVPYDLKTTEQSLLRAVGMRHFPKDGFPAGYFTVPGMGNFPLYPLDPVRQPLGLGWNKSIPSSTGRTILHWNALLRRSRTVMVSAM
jgi:hypothetical protein